MRAESASITADNDPAASETDGATDHPMRGDRETIRPTSPPILECEGREDVRAGIRAAEAKGFSGSALLAVLMSETLPRLVNAYGPANAALILTRIARDLRTGAAPNTTRQ